MPSPPAPCVPQTWVPQVAVGLLFASVTVGARHITPPKSSGTGSGGLPVLWEKGSGLISVPPRPAVSLGEMVPDPFSVLDSLLVGRRQQGMTSWREQFDALAEQYALHFAGQTRLTRNLDMLDHLIGALEDFGLTAPEPLGGEARGMAAQWRSERAAVAAAQESAGPAGRSAARIVTRALFSWHRYQRHFAGLPRQGRDIGLLADIVADLQQASAAIGALTPLSADLQVLQAHLVLAQQELRALREFVEQGNAEQQAAAWASIANTLFTTFHTQFMQRHRLTCRPALLARLCEGLAAVHQQLSTLFADSAADSDHAHNIAAVAYELAQWRNELAQIEQAQTSADVDERVTLLNEAAETVLDEYNQLVAGIEHGTLTTAAVTTLCDRLDEIERQMTPLENLPGLTQNAHNVSMVRDALDMLCDVFDLAARRSTPLPNPPPSPHPTRETQAHPGEEAPKAFG